MSTETAQSYDVKKAIDEIHVAFNEFKNLKKEFIEQEVKGHVDILLKESLDKSNEAISKLEEKLENLQKAELKAKRMNQVGQQLDENPELKQAWDIYIRKGDKYLSAEQHSMMGSAPVQKGYNTVVDSQGGYLVLPYMDNEITRIINETSPIRQYAKVIPISTDQYEKPQITDTASCEWDDDRDSAPTETQTNTFKKLTIVVRGLSALVPVTQRSLEDPVINFEQLLSEMTAEAFERKENTAFISGNGVGKPQGILSYASGTSWGQIEQLASGNSSAITYDGLVEFTDALKPGYNGVMMMNRRTISAIRLLKDGVGRPLYEPAFAAKPAQIFGIPLVAAADMPVIAPNSLAIAYADFKRAYTIIDRKGITLLRDPYTSKGNVLFWTHKRVGGGVDNYEAIKLLKISA